MKKRKYRRSELSSISSIYLDLFKSEDWSKLNDDEKENKKNFYSLLSLQAIWKDALGDFVAKDTLPLSIKYGILTIGVKDSVWMQELSFLTEEIKEKINEKLEWMRIRTIKFKVL